MVAKKHTWKDMSLAPVETHLLLWNEEEGMHIGIYRKLQQLDNWYAIEQTNSNHGVYRRCDPAYWMHLPPTPSPEMMLDDRGFLTLKREES